MGDNVELTEEEELKLEDLKKEYLTGYPNPVPKPKNRDAAAIWKSWCDEKVTKYPLLHKHLKNLFSQGNRREALWFLEQLRASELRPESLGGAIPRKLQPFLIEVKGKKRLSDAELQSDLDSIAANGDDDEVEECLDLTEDGPECIELEDGGEEEEERTGQGSAAAKGEDITIVYSDSEVEITGKLKEGNDDVVVVEERAEKDGKMKKRARPDSSASMSSRGSGSSAVVDMTDWSDQDEESQEDRDLKLAREMAALEEEDQETVWSMMANRKKASHTTTAGQRGPTASTAAVASQLNRRAGSSSGAASLY